MPLDYVVDVVGRDGPAILLLPGGASPSRGFFPGMDRLPGHRIVSLDRPGTGRAASTGPATLTTGADAAAAALRETGCAPAVVLGQSLGGAVAMQLAIDHPDVVSGLVLIDPTPFNDPVVCRQARWLFEALALPTRLPYVGARLDAAIRATDRDVVSAYVESPTFGGGSWLAHLSLLSGIEVRDPDTNALLMTQNRDTLARSFSRRGFRTVALMPGLRQRWPEGTFYGFDEIYGADRLAYRGPEFGWFAIPDQFSLDRLDALEVGRPSRPPLFVFFPTISTHFPFSPTPPYQPDWRRLATPRPYDGPEIVRAYAREPNWTDFGPGYVEAMAYDFATIEGYLRKRHDRDFVMILLGDHQPPAAVSGEGAPWDVPVHVIASRKHVLDGLLAHGFREGLTPLRPSLARMHALLPILLDVFGDRSN